MGSLSRPSSLAIPGTQIPHGPLNLGTQAPVARTSLFLPLTGRRRVKGSWGPPSPNTGFPVSSHYLCYHKQRRKLRLGTETLARGHEETEIKPKSVSFPKPAFRGLWLPVLSVSHRWAERQHFPGAGAGQWVWGSVGRGCMPLGVTIRIGQPQELGTPLHLRDTYPRLWGPQPLPRPPLPHLLHSRFTRPGGQDGGWLQDRQQQVAGGSGLGQSALWLEQEEEEGQA